MCDTFWRHNEVFLREPPKDHYKQYFQLKAVSDESGFFSFGKSLRRLGQVNGACICRRKLSTSTKLHLPILSDKNDASGCASSLDLSGSSISTERLSHCILEQSSKQLSQNNSRSKNLQNEASDLAAKHTIPCRQRSCSHQSTLFGSFLHEGIGSSWERAHEASFELRV